MMARSMSAPSLSARTTYAGRQAEAQGAFRGIDSFAWYWRFS
jgi:hypothetical protein